MPLLIFLKSLFILPIKHFAGWIAATSVAGSFSYISGTFSKCYYVSLIAANKLAMGSTVAIGTFVVGFGYLKLLLGKMLIFVGLGKLAVSWGLVPTFLGISVVMWIFIGKVVLWVGLGIAVLTLIIGAITILLRYRRGMTK